MKVESQDTTHNYVSITVLATLPSTPIYLTAVGERYIRDRNDIRVKTPKIGRSLLRGYRLI